MRPRILWFVIVLSGGAPGCGGSRVRSAAAAGAPGGGGAGGGAAAGGASSAATYAGVVLALANQGASSGYVSRALFTKGPRPVIGGCPKCCCGLAERGLPWPEKPPDAGQITIGSPSDSSLLAALGPVPFENGSGTFYGMSDLGWAWFPPLSDYAPATSQPWSFGDTLDVLAAGDEVASFSGTLHTGPALAGVTPPIGSATVVVDHTQAFEISWTPAANGDATVLLGIPGGNGICYCDAPDSAGRLVVDASLLSPVSSEISLARLSISNVTGGNASVDLVGAVVQKGSLEVR